VTISSPITQRDEVFGQLGAEGGGHSLPWLRIRTETKDGETRTLFTLKRSVTGQLDSIEHETEVSDPAALEGIIKELGNYEPYSDLTKTRQKGNIGDVEICLDEVDSLGSFIEAEKLTADDVDGASIVNELWQLFDSLGIQRADEVTDGYDVLMRKEQGLKP
jgi:adenylate cyclase class 2